MLKGETKGYIKLPPIGRMCKVKFTLVGGDVYEYDCQIVGGKIIDRIYADMTLELTALKD